MRVCVFVVVLFVYIERVFFVEINKNYYLKSY